MLTKQEREAIAERLKGINFLTDNELYKAVTGKSVPRTTKYSEDIKTMIQVILDLCDTSNMVELPLDKDGEVTHIDDIVYDENNKRYEVRQLTLDGNKWFVLAFSGGSCGDGYSFPIKFTHKKPVTVASLVSEIRRTLSKNTIMNKEATSKLCEITDQIEMLGDSDD